MAEERPQQTDGMDSEEQLIARFEKFGTTPPRTRLKIKVRDWDRKQRLQSTNVRSEESPETVAMAPARRSIGGGGGGHRRTCSRILRRNTMDCALLNEMFVINGDGGVATVCKKVDKRVQTLLRDSERQLKNSLATSFTNSAILKSFTARPNTGGDETDEKQDSSPSTEAVLRYHQPKVVESSNRYLSVTSRPIGCRASAPPQAFLSNTSNNGIKTSAFELRREFHDTFSNLIKLGSVDRQDAKLSLEEHIWQTEVKDLIWLELQAWRADRTPEQQDYFLCQERQNVAELLTQIMNYKFEARYNTQWNANDSNADSGLSSDSNISSTLGSSSCIGCLSLYCKDCIEQQELALREVESLLTRLEVAESLYPSSQAMGLFHPLYKSEQFVGRIKAMCLWYNITQQTRLKLIILGKVLTRLQGEKFAWPVQTSFTSTSTDFSNGSSSLSAPETDESSSVLSSTTDKQSPKKIICPRVQFLVNDSTYIPGETTSSNESLNNDVNTDGNTSEANSNRYNRLNSIHDFHTSSLFNTELSCVLYRKFIENVLKSRGLAKSLEFLYKLHNVVMCKAQISLETVDSGENSPESMPEEDAMDFTLEPLISNEQRDELRRFGHSSNEFKSLNLPTYIPIFVFLSGVPLQFMHEFLRMRLETRPMRPNPLSLQQLMKELREGLTLALTHRQRYHRHITTALALEYEEELEHRLGIMHEYDVTVRKAFELYLDYIDQFVLSVAAQNNQKAALEREWMFTKLISPMITGMHVVAAQKFATIIRNLLRAITKRLIERAKELDTQIADTNIHENPSEFKWQILTICRETQALLTAERDRSVKLLFFTKTFCRDVEAADYHREHYIETDADSVQIDVVCPEVKECFKLVKANVLDVRNKLIKIIERVQERCSPDRMLSLEELDRHAVLSRIREILHQGYKFGFEYHKDVMRLFEHRILCDRSDKCEIQLALGIVSFAKMWMQFVTERCEKGRGMRPRWAAQGLDFLILACDPQITCHLAETEFEDLKRRMDCCISHVIGIVTEPERVARKRASPRSRKNSSPCPSRSRTPCRTPILSAPITGNLNGFNLLPSQNRLLLSQFTQKEDGFNSNMPCLQRTESLDSADTDSLTTALGNELNPSVPLSNINRMQKNNLTLPVIGVTQSRSPSIQSAETLLALRPVRIRDAVNRLDLEINEKLQQRNLIGQVKVLNSCDKVQIRARRVHFNWHRGIKIGQGRFGKVYTAVNNNNGELMAMKEIAIYPGETRILKNVAEELKILEGIKHENLVRYYGIEVHREELLIFMELCSDGTLESLVELSSGGLPEGLTRRFTAQLLSGVAELHKHGIVHRDIKTANIFLVAEANSLKLGDFGSAVKIQAHTTVAGELQGYVGTQAYMAPEVFTKTNSDGHGRAADIWSVGCVVVEMSSGKRPWAQFDSNFQIMFKVGMGETPAVPETLSQEGHDFIDHCLQHDPKNRFTAFELLQHNFCKYGREDDFNGKQIIK